VRVKITIKNALTTAIFILCCWLNIQQVQASELKPLYPGYPEIFDITGHKDNLGSDVITIDDMTYQLTPEVQLHGPYGIISRSDIATGAQVGCMLDAQRQVISIWLINNEVQQQQPASSAKDSKPSKFYNKNGVWRN